VSTVHVIKQFEKPISRHDRDASPSTTTSALQKQCTLTSKTDGTKEKENFQKTFITIILTSAPPCMRNCCSLVPSG
jgi:hypothetical protein